MDIDGLDTVSRVGRSLKNCTSSLGLLVDLFARRPAGTLARNRRAMENYENCIHVQLLAVGDTGLLPARLDIQRPVRADQAVYAADHR